MRLLKGVGIFVETDQFPPTSNHLHGMLVPPGG